MDVEVKAQPQEIDEGLYSRQLYVLGVEAMKKMGSSDILIVGVKGLGVEIAKNVALAGVKSITIHDPESVKVQDLGTQYFLAEEDIGKPRAQVTATKLAELNPYVKISVLEQRPQPHELEQFKVVVMTDSTIKDQLAYNEFCHSKGIRFISATTYGLFSNIFTDFGANFTVEDQTGENPLTGIIANIEESEEGVVAVLDESRHGLNDGDYVTFSEIKGMERLNECEPRKVKVLGPYTFAVGSTVGLGKYETGGIFRQVNMPVFLNFQPLDKALEDPEYLITDFSKLERPDQLHLGFRAVDEFRQVYNRLPMPWDKGDAGKVLEIAQKINKAWKNIEIDEGLVAQVSYQAMGDLAPMNSVIGGTVAQEVLKACTGKFTPIKNYMYFDALECLPVNFSPTSEQVRPSGGRYDGQIAVFGREYHEKIQNYREFLVGAGAIGCEMLKNWAMMGLGTGPRGIINVTDMDTIEKSNLNRQFLFKSTDVGELKSAVAARAAVRMNPALTNKILSFEDRVGVETEATFNDEFFGSLDCVTNALDNMEARMYMDRRCVFFCKPLLESGTLGSKGNTQVVIPFVTESYSASRDPPEKSIPMCTLHNFPNAIEHTIQWSRDKFEGLFSVPAQNVNAYLSQPSYVDSVTSHQGDAVQRETFESIISCLGPNKPQTFDDCIIWARRRFDEMFDHAIQQLLFNFPRDSYTTSGQLFWSPPKRAPSPIAFHPDDPHHLDFILAAANLHAANYHIPQSRDLAYIRLVASRIQSVPFVPKSGVVIKVNDNDPEDGTSADFDLDALIASLPSTELFASFRMAPADFEKDDDTNFHIDFVTAASNLRAANYGIKPADRFHTKQIAGKIIPAIATTTAVVSGLVCLELYKLLDSSHKIDDYKNGFVNLALPFFAFSEPIAPETRKFGEKMVSDWDAIFIERDQTLQELIDYFASEYGLELSMLTSGSSMLFSPFLAKKKAEERRPMLISELVPFVSKKSIPEHVKYVTLVACGTDDQDEDVDIPEIRVNIRNK